MLENRENLFSPVEENIEFHEKQESIQDIMENLGIDDFDDLDLGEINLDALEITNDGLSIHHDQKGADTKSSTPSIRAM